MQELWFEPAGGFRVSIPALFHPGWLWTLGVRNFRYSRSLDYLFVTNGGLLDKTTQVKTHSVTIATVWLWFQC